MNKSENPVSYKELVKFFFPLAVAPFIIGAVHNIANAAIARLPAPELSLAVFTVVKGLSNIIRAPIFMGKQAIISLVTDKQSYKLVIKLLWFIGLVIITILFLLGYTPLGEWVLRNIIGLKEAQQIEYGYYSLKIIFLLPLVELLRNNNQGLAISLKKTKFILPGILFRLVSVSLFLWWVVRSQAMLGVIAGSAAWVGGIGLEGIFIFVVIRYIYNSPQKAAVKISEQKLSRDKKENMEEKEEKAGEKKKSRKIKDKLNIYTFFKFLGPLALMMMLTRLVQPVIQGGIARGSSPTRSLAAFGVAWTVVFLFTGPLRVLNQCSLVYVNKIYDKNWNHLLRFAFFIGIITGIILILLALTPLGYWLIHVVLAISNPVTDLAQKTLIIFALFPVIRSFREAYWGILMNQQKTYIIGGAKLINVVVVLIFLIFGIFAFEINAALIGAFAFLLGEAFESWFIRFYSLKDKTLIIN